MSSDWDAERSLDYRVKQTLKFLRLALWLTWRASPRLLIGILLLIGLEALFAPVMLILSKTILDSLALRSGLATAPQPVVAHFSLEVWISLAAVVLAASQLIRPLALTLHGMAGDRINIFVGEQLILAANRWRGLARFEDPDFADDLMRARGGGTQSGLELMYFGAEAVVSLVTVIALLVVLGGLHFLVPILLVLVTLPQIAQHYVFLMRTGGALYGQTPDARRLEYSRDLLLTAPPAKDVRLYDMGSFLARRYDAIFARTTSMLDSLRKRSTASITAATVLSSIAGGAVYIYVVWLIGWGGRPIGDLALYGGAVTMLQIHLLELGRSLGFLPNTFVFLPSVHRILSATPDLPVSRKPLPAPRPIRKGIVFDKVTFSYPGSDTPVLSELSFSFSPGECLALVGQNGAGKTTAVKLLLRMYDPTDGRILLDGVDLREYDLDDLRREMGVIFQDFGRYELSVEDNIGFGQVEELENVEHILEAASRADASELIRDLPNGLKTRLGREFGGRELSVGEWQKLALARAFMRDSQILVLGEPTAALDVESEYSLYVRFHELTKGRTTLLISHRFSTVQMADRILFLANGGIEEEGSHPELMARGGTYARLFRLQQQNYLGNQAEPSH